MDQGLFAKYIHSILVHTNTKQKIATFLLEKTGVVVEESEITIIKKNITLSISSVKKTILIQKRSKDILQTIGYTLTF